MALLKPEAQARAESRVTLACASGFRDALCAETSWAMNHPGEPLVLWRTAAPRYAGTVRVVCQRLLQPTGRFRRRSLGCGSFGGKEFAMGRAFQQLRPVSLVSLFAWGMGMFFSISAITCPQAGGFVLAALGFGAVGLLGAAVMNVIGSQECRIQEFERRLRACEGQDAGPSPAPDSATRGGSRNP